ncbi:amidohydrolase [Sinomonas halotolerans]|uniref:Amidohydrolase n=1 Tax=Sinomonas halotolerans TaxID=1644133 RepID=A0ABU9WXS4_9MICC
MLFDALFANGQFRTQDPARPLAGAIGVHAGRIISLDDELGPESFRTVHDLGGATAVPGFNDAHYHLSHVGQADLQLDLRPAVAPSLDALLAAVSRAAAAADPHAWVIGSGYDQNRLGAHPTAEQLDSVSHGRPVYLIHSSRHMGVANTRAFELAGFPGRRGIVAPDGGAAPAAPDGRAVGLLQETARALVMEAIPGPSAADVADYVAAGSRAALAVGLTSVTEPGLGAPEGIGMSRWDLAGYQLARDQGRLGVRATVMPYLTTLHRIDGAETEGHPHYGLDLGTRTGLGDDLLRVGPVKVLSDGSLIGRSAYMLSEYEADALEGSHNHGMLQFAEEELRERLIGAHLAGWQLAVHAIGDAALDVAMDIIEAAHAAAPRADARHRIEHLSVASDAQIARVARLGIVPVPQGRFVSELGDGVLRALGPERARLAYRVRSLLDAGIELPASTDAPVVDGSPLLNIHDLVNRRTAAGAEFGPDERITVAQAVRASTVGSAYASHDETRKGTLARGMLADFAVLSQDLYTIPAQEIAETEVRATVVAGRIAYGDL